jgi:large subunit ribosomal protein L15
MKFNELELKKNKKANRVGRGIAAGQGKTAGRGTKGQRSRAGSGKKPGFEGGQNPLYKRIPKLRGFTPFWDKPTTITTAQLNQFKGLVDNFTLYEAKLISKPDVIARVVVRGDLTSKVDVKLQGASEKAIAAITKAGGSFDKVDRVKATASEKEEK